MHWWRPRQVVPLRYGIATQSMHYCTIGGLLLGSNAIRVSKICQWYNTQRCPGRDDVLVQMVPSCWQEMSNRWSYLPRRSSSLIWSEMILVLIAKIVTDSCFHFSSYSCPTFVFIGPESDHCLPLSLTHSLTNSLTHSLTP